MQIVDTPLADLKVFEIVPIEDSRGFFARTFCAEEASAVGLEPSVAQCSISFNPTAHTLRGLHWQVPPYAEDKLVRCTAGVIYDVAVDLRQGSPTFGRWFGTYLSARNHRALFLPVGFGHGFLTLEPDAEVFYQISRPFAPGFSRGLSWCDPEVGIKWPATPAVISDRDAALPALQDLPDAALFSFPAKAHDP